MTALSLFHSPPPDVVLEITPRHVAALAVSTDRSGQTRILAHAVEPVPAGAVMPALNAPNISRPDDVAHAVERAFGTLGQRPRRVALVVPDSVAKVSFVRFATVPAKTSDLDEMVKFQVRKAAPFRIEDARVSYVPGITTADGQEFVVTQARLDIIAEYECACADAGAHAGLVGLSTFNVANAVLAGTSRPSGDWLLLHVQADAVTLAILRGSDLVFFRHRGPDGEGQLADLVHQTAMYYQDRLAGSGFARVMMAGPLPDDSQGTTRRALESRLGVAIEAIDLTKSVPFSDRLVASRIIIDAITPAMGLAMACRS